MHKTETIDYGIQLFGERVLRLDDGEVALHPGDIVVQVGAWHQWTAPREGGIMLFDMIAASFVDGPAGLAQGNDAPLRAEAPRDLPAGVKLPRRIVTIDREAGRGCTVSVGPAPDVRTDPARPGFANARLWVTDSAPAKIVYETLHLPHTLEPPCPGSVLRVLCLPPDASWQGKVGANEVRAYFQAMGSPQASTYAPGAPHPYMQKTRTLDFCAVIEGEATLVLDTQEVKMAAGDVAILRAANHAWSNRSGQPARVAIASHAAA
jgi:quercetin dioxygenase-like cupin family protein